MYSRNKITRRVGGWGRKNLLEKITFRVGGIGSKVFLHDGVVNFFSPILLNKELF